ncbi:MULTISPECIES: YjzD family protein [unclassified Granulicatella]|uniref:YjzD family protein n=1 Tax=unclassified Granulicatella TaxID=2630493 RepID=UPI00107446F2|nr:MULTISPECIES: YjzD family protein [unclassified Granulicatella]MBF0780302.1 YjzD family protein [Granulicatella sp. 19428wC4_WM01]TFU95580.1 DUF2929 family protein [Granulicatella sp. WM01]
MKYFVTFIWALLISQVTFYIGASLNHTQYNPVHAFILAIFATISVAIIVAILPPVAKDNSEKH